MTHVVTGAVAVVIVVYGLVGVWAQMRAIGRLATTDARRRTMRVLAGVNLARWIVIAGLFVAAFAIDGICVPTPENPDHCMETLLPLGTALLTVTVLTEVYGHRLVRRNLRGAMEDPGEPAPPIPLRPVRDDEDGTTDGDG